MYKFLMGLFAGYLTMTKDGQKITKKVSDDIGSYLKKEGVIEPDKTTRPTEPLQSDDKPKEQSSPVETVNE